MTQAGAEPRLSRRFVIRAMALGCGLALTLDVRASPASAAAPTTLATHLLIAADNTVTLLWPVSELGQGAHTGLAVLLASELDPDWSRLRVETADLDPRYVDDMTGMRTAGSDAIMRFHEPVRRLGASAREMLRTAAAARWRVPVTQTRAAAGVVHHDGSGRSATFGALAESASRLKPPRDVPLRATPLNSLGAGARRVDAAAKSDGTARFGVDVQLPGLLSGAVLHCPAFGGRLRAVNPAPALAVKGVVQVVPLDDAVIVLAEGHWQAAKGAAALAPDWDLGAAARLDDAAIGEALDTALASAQVGPRSGDVDAALRGAARTVRGRYDVPYLSHWVMEPMNATAWVRADGVEVWGPIQGQSDNRRMVAQAVGVDPDKVLVHTTYVGGSFGRRMQADVAVQAALASKAAGRPVKLIWSREQDTRHGFYRPRAVFAFEGGVDAVGRPVAIKTAMAENSTLQDFARRNLPALFDDLPAKLSDCLKGEAYNVPNFQFAHADVVLPVPVGAWHSVQFSHNGFVGESIIDELAHLAGQDPMAFRLHNLTHPRYRGVLSKVAELSGWGRALPAGHGLGAAMVDSFGTVVAQVVEVSVKDKAVTLVGGWCAVDCGVAVYPPGVESQMVTGMTGGLSAAFYNEINLKDGAVVQSNFDDDRLIRMAQAPTIKVAIVDSGAPMGGAGESALPPAAPALTNAIFAATGERVRSLPLVRSGWSLA